MPVLRSEIWMISLKQNGCQCNRLSMLAILQHIYRHFTWNWGILLGFRGKGAKSEGPPHISKIATTKNGINEMKIISLQFLYTRTPLYMHNVMRLFNFILKSYPTVSFRFYSNNWWICFFTWEKNVISLLLIVICIKNTTNKIKWKWVVPKCGFDPATRVLNARCFIH